MKEKEYTIKDYNVLINQQNILIAFGYISLALLYLDYQAIGLFIGFIFLIMLTYDSIKIQKW